MNGTIQSTLSSHLFFPPLQFILYLKIESCDGGELRLGSAEKQIMTSASWS